ncbi:MAG: hypothetical protein HUU01_15655, partial [Saprospiraceae bacterium]|nr:hypothetical protein [Saprospiraceae bacterium]
PIKVVAKPSFKSRLFSWLGDQTAYRNGPAAGVNYFLDSKNESSALNLPASSFLFTPFGNSCSFLLPGFQIIKLIKLLVWQAL